MPAAKAPTGVFISYRRANASAHAGRLRDRLTAAFPGMPIFMDVDSIEAGSNFEDAIKQAIGGTSHLLALVAPDLGDSDHLARLNQPGDFVRLEIAAALAANRRVIPVLLDDARMPAEADLPNDLAAFAKCNAVEIRHSRFDDDAANLIQALGGVRPQAGASPLRQVGTFLAWAAGGGLAAFLAVVAQNAATGLSLGYYLGPFLAVAFVPAIACVAGAFGLYRLKSRR